MPYAMPPPPGGDSGVVSVGVRHYTTAGSTPCCPRVGSHPRGTVTRRRAEELLTRVIGRLPAAAASQQHREEHRRYLRKRRLNPAEYRQRRISGQYTQHERNTSSAATIGSEKTMPTTNCRCRDKSVGDATRPLLEAETSYWTFAGAQRRPQRSPTRKPLERST